MFNNVSLESLKNEVVQKFQMNGIFNIGKGLFSKRLKKREFNDFFKNNFSITD